jgi:hypothetical protein
MLSSGTLIAVVRRIIMAMNRTFCFIGVSAGCEPSGA